MLEVGVDAATDVTGFGLIGHLLEMLGDGLDAVLDLAAIPLLPQAVELAGEGVSPGGTKRNYAATKDRFDDPGLDTALREVLFDAQTSGGLLIAIKAVRASSVLDRLHERGVTQAAQIGSIVEGSGRVKVGQ
jgi:selenide,water dikinase